eukprot:CAMPEP_0178398532 /NCGR_PEP_ID=MMETSP0689_2-20121128/14821_1 /TAXON_ID=160604 /ORGANISM="Amphidinium massartii, Strain CS-259" /LENGTH=83 /DNA_ID=CAMNT_0020019297 /DNA_START=16 /DNA_END=267 /DNA_ORIENTATION=+
MTPMKATMYGQAGKFSSSAKAGCIMANGTVAPATAGDTSSPAGRCAALGEGRKLRPATQVAATRRARESTLEPRCAMTFAART